MTEYIDRKAVEEMIENAEYIAPAFGLCGGYCIDDIDLSSIPTADVAPVVHGKWVHDHYEQSSSQFEIVKCTNCDYRAYAMAVFVKEGNYCPNCGAKIDLEEWEK